MEEFFDGWMEKIKEIQGHKPELTDVRTSTPKQGSTQQSARLGEERDPLYRENLKNPSHQQNDPRPYTEALPICPLQVPKSNKPGYDEVWPRKLGKLRGINKNHRSLKRGQGSLKLLKNYPQNRITPGMKKGEQYYQPQPTPQVPEPVLVAPEWERAYYASGPAVAQRKLFLL